MKMLKYTDEVTLKSETVEFQDEHYELANSILRQCVSGSGSKFSPLMVQKDKKSLYFCVNLDDKSKDKDTCEQLDHTYRIIVEKIETDTDAERKEQYERYMKYQYDGIKLIISTVFILASSVLLTIYLPYVAIISCIIICMGIAFYLYNPDWFHRN